MSADHTLKNYNEINSEEHRSVNGVNAKAVATYGYDGTNLVPIKVASDGTLASSSSSGSVPSTLNSTTTPLAANATFTGSWEDITAYDFIDATLYTDVDSVTNGALLQFSTDGGTTTERTVPATITGGLGAYNYTIPLTAYTHFRFVYTNGASPQTAFHVRVVKQTGASPLILAPIGSVINATQSAHLTRSVIAAQKLDGSISNIATTNSGYLQVDIAQSDVNLGIAALNSLAVKQLPVTGTATQITTAVTGRKTISLRALLSNTANIYLGTTNAVATGNGYELGAGESIDFELSETQPLWVITSTGTQTICVAEIY